VRKGGQQWALVARWSSRHEMSLRVLRCSQARLQSFFFRLAGSGQSSLGTGQTHRERPSGTSATTRTTRGRGRKGAERTARRRSTSTRSTRTARKGRKTRTRNAPRRKIDRAGIPQKQHNTKRGASPSSIFNAQQLRIDLRSSSRSVHPRRLRAQRLQAGRANEARALGRLGAAPMPLPKEDQWCPCRKQVHVCVCARSSPIPLPLLEVFSAFLHQPPLASSCERVPHTHVEELTQFDKVLAASPPGVPYCCRFV